MLVVNLALPVIGLNSFVVTPNNGPSVLRSVSSAYRRKFRPFSGVTVLRHLPKFFKKTSPSVRPMTFLLVV